MIHYNCDCCGRTLSEKLPYYSQEVSGTFATGSGKDRKAVPREDQLKAFCTLSCVSKFSKAEAPPAGAGINAVRLARPRQSPQASLRQPASSPTGCFPARAQDSSGG